jgi:hypothetical protein
MIFIIKDIKITWENDDISFQTDVDVTVAIPNGDLWKVNGDQGYLDYVVGQLKNH